MNGIVDTKILDKIIKALSIKAPYVKVGILGSAAARNDGEKTNAEIGAIHEFGAPAAHIPQRSFLRMPVFDHLQKRINNFEKQKTLSLPVLLYKVGASAKSIIQEAFTNTGFGKWPVSKAHMGEKKGNTLVDTGQLRDSINFEVVQ